MNLGVGFLKRKKKRNRKTMVSFKETIKQKNVKGLRGWISSNKNKCSNKTNFNGVGEGHFKNLIKRVMKSQKNSKKITKKIAYQI